jgi:hypothetical protein
MASKVQRCACVAATTLTGEERKQRGMARALGVDSDFGRAAQAAWSALLLSQERVTTDDLWRVLAATFPAVDIPDRANVVGAIVHRSSAAKDIERTGDMVTTRPTGQGRRISVWRSLVYRGSDAKNASEGHPCGVNTLVGGAFSDPLHAPVREAKVSRPPGRATLFD